MLDVVVVVKLLDDASGLFVLNLLIMSGSDVWIASFLTSSISVVAVGDLSINGLLFREMLLHNICDFFDETFSSQLRDSLGSTSGVSDVWGVGLKL